MSSFDPVGHGIWNPRPRPSFLQILSPTDWGVHLQEGFTNDDYTSRATSACNINRSGHWVSAILLSTMVPWLVLEILAILGIHIRL